tara:strand:- start:118 stop:339 length:222 start_codon:yes stop_codon:yes gene_type:complete
MTLLTAIIFNFYTMAWEPFPQVAPEQYSTMEECVVQMNDINRHMESQHSALRTICIWKEEPEQPVSPTVGDSA